MFSCPLYGDVDKFFKQYFFSLIRMQIMSQPLHRNVLLRVLLHLCSVNKSIILPVL
jgi:hypothetical protein